METVQSAYASTGRSRLTQHILTSSLSLLDEVQERLADAIFLGTDDGPLGLIESCLVEHDRQPTSSAA